MDSASPGPAHFAFNATHGIHGLFSAQQRKAGAPWQQEEAGQEAGAYHLVGGRRRGSYRLPCGPCTALVNYLPGPGQPSKAQAGGSAEPDLQAA